MTTIEGNKLIAVFMGYEYIEPEKSYYSWGWWVKGTFNDDAIDNPNFLCIYNSYLKYNSLWDWLRPSWDKFQDIDFDQFPLNSQHRKHCDHISFAFAYLTIDIAFSRMIDGIEWYNQNKESK